MLSPGGKCILALGVYGAAVGLGISGWAYYKGWRAYKKDSKRHQLNPDYPEPEMPGLWGCIGKYVFDNEKFV